MQTRCQHDARQETKPDQMEESIEVFGITDKYARKYTADMIPFFLRSMLLMSHIAKTSQMLSHNRRREIHNLIVFTPTVHTVPSRFTKVRAIYKTAKSKTSVQHYGPVLCDLLCSFSIR